MVVVFATAAAAQALRFELLLSLLVAGFLVENVAPVRAEPLVHALHLMAVPVFVIFFAMAGAELRLAGLRGALAAGARRGAAPDARRSTAAARGRGAWGGAEPAWSALRLDRAGLPGRGGARPRDHRGGPAARGSGWRCRR